MGFIKITFNIIGTFNAKCNKYLPNKNKAVLFLKEAYYATRHGCSPDDFFRYEFYKKSNFERKKFITYRRSQRIMRQYNDKNAVHIFQDKIEFNKFFKDFIKRNYLDLSVATQEEFSQFVEKHSSVIMKPTRGGQGKGIFKIKSDEIANYSVDDYRNYICEELLIQHPKMSTINPSSVNTIRVLTFKGDVIACALRSGGGGDIVDNLHSSGVCAHLDIGSGIIDAPCIDNTLKKHLYHPYTKIILPGFQVPNWDLLLEKAREAAKLIPSVQYVGWDMVILEDDIAIIEGNNDPGHDVVQMIVQEGLYEKIKALEKNSFLHE